MRPVLPVLRPWQPLLLRSFNSIAAQRISNVAQRISNVAGRDTPRQAALSMRRGCTSQGLFNRRNAQTRSVEMTRASSVVPVVANRYADSSSRSAFASFRSRVSKPSVNQP
jgi:hypothetical protein